MFATRSRNAFLAIASAFCLSLLLLAAFTVSARAGEGSVLSAGGLHTCGIDFNGAVVCWGDGEYGQLGNGATADSAVPVAVTGLPSGARMVATGFGHSCAVVAGAVKCWGDNTHGQLGNGTTTNSTTPVNVTGLDANVTAITAGHDHTCAIQHGAAKCWGLGTSGQLGNGVPGDINVPVQVAGLTSEVTSVSAGGLHTCAVIAGASSCWGDNSSGQLGDGSQTGSLGPVNVAGLPMATASISSGFVHTCALRDGSAKCWGAGWSAQLGDGVTYAWGTGSPSLRDVIGLSTGVTGIASGFAHTCAVQNGAAKCWGRGSDGQLGDGVAYPFLEGSTTPRAVVGLDSGVTAITGSGDHSCALASGVAKCWGRGERGQLGNGNVASSMTPVDVSGFSPAGTRPAAPSIEIKRSGKAKVKGKNVTFAITFSTWIPAGFSAEQACGGKVTATTKPTGMRKTAKSSAKLNAADPACVATLRFKLPKKFKNKKIKIRFVLLGNVAFVKTTRTIRHKVR